jgi:hypothetical protein
MTFLFYFIFLLSEKVPVTKSDEELKNYQYRPVLVEAVRPAAGSGTALEAFPVLLRPSVHPPGLLDDGLRQQLVAG